MRKTFVLDTSVLIDNPRAYQHFEHSDVVIPVKVLEELDRLKTQSADVGKSARVAIKLLDELSDLGDISLGILVDNDILVKIDSKYYFTPEGFGDSTLGDTAILACAYALWQDHPTNDVCLVSNDFNLKIKAKARGLEAICHKKDNTMSSDLYSGLKVVNNEEAGYELQQHGSLDTRAYDLNLFPHECVLFQDDDGNGLAMGRKVSQDRVRLLKKHFPWGISSRNKEQAFAMDLIMDRNIDLVTLIGKAGTGKSLIVLATALELVLNRREYDKLVIYRPIQSVGNDIGFLPGTMEEKLAPWFQAIMDNFEFLFSNKSVKGGSADWKKDLEMFQRKGQIEMEAITYIRGRSIPNSIILIDEAQNLNKEEIKTILTRAGEGTKIILTGDIEQIDNSLLDATNNGLTYTIEKFKDLDLAGHVTLTQGERSKLASKAAEIL